MKQGTIEDIERFLPAAKWFFAKTKIAGDFNPDCFVNYWRHLLNSGAGKLFLSEVDGEVTEAIGVVCGNSMFDGQLIATVCFWYVGDTDRGLGVALMFNQLLNILNAMNAKRINIHALYEYQFAPVSMFLERAGFVAKEVAYQRQIV